MVLRVLFPLSECHFCSLLHIYDHFLAGFRPETWAILIPFYSLGCLRFIRTLYTILTVLGRKGRFRRPCVGVEEGVDGGITGE